jgi:hypothetical protein
LGQNLHLSPRAALRRATTESSIWEKGLPSDLIERLRVLAVCGAHLSTRHEKLELDISQGESMFTKVSIITALAGFAMCLTSISAEDLVSNLRD